MNNTTPLTDDRLLDGLQAADLSPESFRHRDHLRAAWLYLERWPLPEALARLSADLLAFATVAGAPEMFHTTITWALVFALDERRRALADGHSWSDLEASAPELLDWKRFLGRYYTDQLLWSQKARATFVLPDRLAGLAKPLAAAERARSHPGS